jgi:ATP-dependent Clp protease ATP-binding subunit ClpB
VSLQVDKVTFLSTLSIDTMNSGNFTHKAQESLFQAQNLAQEKGQQQVDALHLLYSLLSQEESVVLTLLQKIGADVGGLKRKAEAALERLPVVATVNPLGQFYLTQDLAKVLERARQEASKMGDEYVSVEHLFLALLDTDSKAKETLERTSFLRPGIGGTEAVEFGRLDYEIALKILAQSTR